MINIFVSYAHVNNQDLGNRGGWVSKTTNFIEKKLAEKLGRSVSKFWQDKQNLTGNLDIDTAIKSALDDAEILLVFYSAGYISSLWCRRELEYFFHKVEPDSGRIFLIKIDDVGDNVLGDDLNREFYALIGYKFWEIDQETGAIQILGAPGCNNRQNRLYHRMVNKIAQDIAHSLSKHNQKEPPVEISAPSTAQLCLPRIFLANVSDDLLGHRQDMQTFLGKHKCIVLPQTEYSFPDIPQYTKQDIGVANCFVQLLSDTYAFGYPFYQYELAKKADTLILQWRDPQQKLSNLSHLKQQLLLNAPTVSTGTFDSFKQQVLSQCGLNPSTEGHTSIDTTPESSPAFTVFLADTPDSLSDERDKVRTYLEDSGIRVLSASGPTTDDLVKILHKTDCFVQLVNEGSNHEQFQIQYQTAERMNVKIYQWRHPEWQPPEIVIVADEKDFEWVAKFETQLQPLEKKGQLSLWHLRKIPAGADRHQEISRALEKAKIAVLFFSAEFLACDFYNQYESMLRNRIQAHQLICIPVMARSCLYESSEFKHLSPFNSQSLNRQQDEADFILANLAKDIDTRIGAYWWRNSRHLKLYSLRSLQQEIMDYLHSLPNRQKRTDDGDKHNAQTGKTVFIDACREDLTLALQMAEFFQAQKIAYRLPISVTSTTDPSPTELKQNLAENLQVCDAIVIAAQNIRNKKWIQGRVNECGKYLAKNQRQLKILAITHPIGQQPVSRASLPPGLQVSLLDCPQLTAQSCLPRVVRALEGEYA